ncbi:MAG: alpha/beta fold hydrolase [Gammaproteobacteria bacterium]
MADSIGDTIKLADGRQLGWAEFGDPQGLPLFYFHGFPASRLEGKLIEAAALRNGIRVIAPDRPGYGISDFQPGRRLLDWPCDVEALADCLRIDRFIVLGMSGGGPYALACAHTMAPRLRTVGVVCGLGPVFEPWARRSMHWPARLGFGLARRSKRLLRFAYGGVTAWVIKQRPETLRRLLTSSAPEADSSVVRQPEINQILFDSAREALRQGPEGALWDFIAYAHPWGFEPQDIRCRVQLWHGKADALVPPAHGHYFATELPNVVADFLPGEGHFSLAIKHTDLILRALASDRAES